MTILQISQVSKTFASQGHSTQALLATDLSVAENDFITILGPSGCGKSTLLRMVATMRNKVDLPHPEGPRMVMKSFSATDKSVANRACVLWPWEAKVLLTCEI